MSDATNLFNEPAAQRLLAKRSRLRWSFSASLIGAYLGYGLMGLVAADTYAAPFFGSSMPWGMALGFALIGLSVAMSMIYVLVANRLDATTALIKERQS